MPSGIVTKPTTNIIVYTVFLKVLYKRVTLHDFYFGIRYKQELNHSQPQLIFEYGRILKVSTHCNCRQQSYDTSVLDWVIKV